MSIRMRARQSHLGYALRYAGLAIGATFVLPRPWASAAQSSPSSPVPSVAVSLPECEEDVFPWVAFLDSLRVELAASGLSCCSLAEASTPTEQQTLHVRLETPGACGAEPERVRIEVQQPSGSRSTEREISLGDVTFAARPRALALVVAELIRSLAEEVHEEPPAPAPSAPQRPQSKPQPVALPRASLASYAIHADADARLFPARDTLLWGGRAGVTAVRSSMSLGADMGGSFSNIQTSLGELRVRSASIGVGLGPRLASSNVALDVGPRAELGWAWIGGTTSLTSVGTNSGSGLVANLGFRASLGARVHPRLVPHVALEAGGVVRGLNANVDGKITAGIGGFYSLVALGMSTPL